MNNLKKLTIVIVTYLTDRKTLLNCLKSIDKNVKILIVENSKKFKDRYFFLSRYPNIEIINTGKNLGYGGGNNFGLKFVKTDYALILNPDTILDNFFFKKINLILNMKHFSIIGCTLKKNLSYVTGGFFNQKKNKLFQNNFLNRIQENKFIKVDWVTGNSMLLNLKKFKNLNFFDENFFLYYEEFDLCLRLKKKNKNIYLSKDLKVEHKGFKSSNLNFRDFNLEAEKLRNWHWMWSVFYFHRKNFGYSNALFKTINKLFKSAIKTLIYLIIFNKKKKEKYFFRTYGLFSSMLGRKSFYRGKYFN